MNETFKDEIKELAFGYAIMIAGMAIDGNNPAPQPPACSCCGALLTDNNQ